MVAGHQGMVGSAVCRLLESRGFDDLIKVGRNAVDLTNQSETENFVKTMQPECMIIAAAKVGGIGANSTYPAEFLYDNLMIECNLIHAAYQADVSKLLFLGSSCIYPKCAPQPIREEHLLTSALEPTNKAYAIAKIAGLELCSAYNQQYGCGFFAAMPCNLYGYGDNFHLTNSHVLPALLRKFHEATIQNLPTVSCWGTGKPRREFLFVEDLADAILFLLDNFHGPGFINVGAGEDISIRELAELIAEITKFKGSIVWDSSKPDGTMNKLLDSQRLTTLGWKPKTSLREGLEKTYRWFIDNADTLRKE